MSGSGGPRTGRANSRPHGATTTDHGKPSLSRPGHRSGKGLPGQTPTPLHTDVPGFRAATPAQLPLVTRGQVDGAQARGVHGFAEETQLGQGREPCGGRGLGQQLGEARPSTRDRGSRVHVPPGGLLLLPQLPPAAERGGTARRHGTGGQTWVDGAEQGCAFVGADIRAWTGLGAAPLAAGTRGLALATFALLPRPQLDSSFLRPLLQPPAPHAAPCGCRRG